MARSTNWGCKKKKLKSYILKRDVLKGKCYLCGNTLDHPSLDHVMPISRQGANAWSNILWTCFKCNTKKLARLPRPCELLLLNVVNNMCVKARPTIVVDGLWHLEPKRLTLPASWYQRVEKRAKRVGTLMKKKWFALVTQLGYCQPSLMYGRAWGL